MVNASVSLSERAVAEKPVVLKDPGALRSLNPEVREHLGRALCTRPTLETLVFSETMKFNLNPCCNFSVPLPALKTDFRKVKMQSSPMYR